MDHWVSNEKKRGATLDPSDLGPVGLLGVTCAVRYASGVVLSTTFPEIII